jgi:hypothetical protein
VEQSDSFLLRVYQKYRKAIGGLDGKENLGRACDEAIAD